MISTFFLTVLNAFVSLLLDILPTGAFSSGFQSAISYFMGVLNSFSYIFPVAALVEALAVALVFDGAILFWHLIQWVIRKVPGMQ